LVKIITWALLFARPSLMDLAPLWTKFSSLRSQIMVITTKANQVHLMLEELITLLPSPKQVQAPLHYDPTSL